MIKRLQSIMQQTGSVFKTYPWVLLFGFLATVFAIFTSEVTDFRYNSTLVNRFPYLDQIPFFKLTVLSILSISLFFGLSMVQQVNKWKWLTVLGLLLSVVYFLLFPGEAKSWTGFDVAAYAVLFLMHHLAVSFLPFLFLKDGELAFWSYNKTLFSNLAQTALFVGVLTGGLLLAIAAIENLFNLYIFTSRLYLYVTFISGIFGSVFVFLLFTNDGLETLIADEEVPAVQRFFVQYILIPLLLIYGLILYAYTVKIIGLWSLPKGWVSYLVIAYAALGITSNLLIYPLFDQKGKVWVRVFDKIFYFSLIPLLILLFVAIFTRLFEYGVTPNRYFVLMLAIWIAGISIYFSLNSKGSIKIIPISLFLLGFVSIALPYFNVFDVSLRSQKQRMMVLLESNMLLKDGYIDTDAPIKRSELRQITDVATFLGKNRELAYIKGLFENPKENDFEDHNYFGSWMLVGYFTNIVEDDTINAERYEIVISQKDWEQPRFVDVSEVDYFYTSEPHYRGIDIVLNDFLLTIDQNHWDKREPKKMIFILKDNQKKVIESHSLTEFIQAVFDQYKLSGYGEQLPPEELSHTFSLGTFDFRIEFEEIRFVKSQNDSPEASDWDFENTSFFSRYVIFVKEKTN